MTESAPTTAPDTENSVSPVKPVAPAAIPVAVKSPRHVYGLGLQDDVLYSRVRDTTRTRKSLTIKHLQRRLTELGFSEASADLDGHFGVLTGRAVDQWLSANKHELGYKLTPEQFSAIFKDDTNVNVVLD